MQNAALKNHPALQQLQILMRQDRLPHALLLTGGSWEEKRAMALDFAGFLLCAKADKKNAQPCGQCVPCGWMRAEGGPQHPDVLMFPTETGASIKIDEIRMVTQHLAQAPHQGKYKIILLAPAEAMPIGAMNALLKTLEEPPPHSLLILASQHPGLLPATLQSRCQRVIFRDSPADFSEKQQNMLEWQKVLQALQERRLAVDEAAQASLKNHELAGALEQLYYCAAFMALQWVRDRQIDRARRILLWQGKVQAARVDVMARLNPNGLLTLENLFYQWVQLHYAG